MALSVSVSFLNVRFLTSRMDLILSSIKLWKGREVNYSWRSKTVKTSRYLLVRHFRYLVVFFKVGISL